MKTKEEFREYYEKELVNKTNEYSKISRYYCGMGLLIYLVLIYFCLVIKNLLPVSLTMVISLVGIVYCEYKLLNILKKKYNEELVFDIVKFISNNNSTATIQYNSRVARDVLQECGIFNFDKLKFKGSNYTVMRENGYGIVLSDVKLWNWKNVRGQAKDTFFEGVYFSRTPTFPSAISFAASVTGESSFTLVKGILPCEICLALLAVIITNLNLFSTKSNNSFTVGFTIILISLPFLFNYLLFYILFF